MKNIKNINYILLILLVLVLIYILLKCRRKNMEKFTTVAVAEAEAAKVAAEQALQTPYTALKNSLNTTLNNDKNFEGHLKDIVDNFHTVYNNLKLIAEIGDDNFPATEGSVNPNDIRFAIFNGVEQNIQSEVYNLIVGSGNVFLPKSDFSSDSLSKITEPQEITENNNINIEFTGDTGSVEETAFNNMISYYNNIKDIEFTIEEANILVEYNKLFTEISGGGGGVEIATNVDFTTLKKEMDTEADDAAAVANSGVDADARKTEYLNALQSIFFNYSVDKNKITELKTEIEDINNFAVTGIPKTLGNTITNDISGLDNNVFGDLINLYNNFNTSLTKYNNADTALILATEEAARKEVIKSLTKEEKDQIFEGSSRRIDLTGENQTFHTNTSNLDNIDKHILWMNYTDAHEFDIDVRNFDDIDYGESDFNNQSTKIGYFKQVLSNSSTSINNKVILHPGNSDNTDISKDTNEEFIFGLDSGVPNSELGLKAQNHKDYFTKSHIFVGSIILEFSNDYSTAKKDLEDKFLLLNYSGEEVSTNTPANIERSNEKLIKKVPLNSPDIEIKQKNIIIGDNETTKVGIFFRKNLPFDMETLIRKGDIDSEWKGVKITIADKNNVDSKSYSSVTLNEISNIYVNFVFFKANKADKMTEMYNLINANYKILQYKTQILVNYFRCKDQKKEPQECDLMDVGFKTSDIDSRLWGALKAIPPPPPEDEGPDSGITNLEDIVDKKELIIKLLAQVNNGDRRTLDEELEQADLLPSVVDGNLFVDDVYKLLGMRNPNPNPNPNP